MNICHLILTNNFAGSEKYCSDLANYQVSNNKVLVIKAKEVNSKISIKKFLNQDIYIEEIGSFFKIYQIKKILRKYEINIIHTHLGKASKLAKNLDLPNVATLHIDYKKKDYQHLNGLICINQMQYEKAFNFKGPKKIIYNWLPQIEEINKNKINSLKLNIFKNDKDFIFGYFGRFNKSKNISLLIESFVEAKLSNSKLLIIGDGEEKEKITKKYDLNTNIVFLPTQIDIYPFYGLIDCFVLPSTFEPFGLVLLEAMHFNKQIICGNIPISKFLPSNSVLKNYTNEEMIKMLTNKYQLGKIKINYDLSEFVREKQILKIQKFYKEIIKRN